MRTTSFVSSLGLFGFLVMGLVSCSAVYGDGCSKSCSASKTTPGSADRDKESPDIVDTAVAAGQFNTLVTAIKVAGLAETLKGKGPYTVFAPTDDAFKRLPEGALDSLLKDKVKLKAVLLYHVVPGRVMASQVVKLREAKTALGQKVKVDARKGVRINDAKVVKADISTRNGVIHVIDRVLLPKADILDTAKAAGSFNTLLAAVEAAGLTATLRGAGPYTVLAPTDAAFQKLPNGTLEALLADKAKLQSILLYHVVPGAVTAKELAKLSGAKTAQGQSVRITVADSIKVNDASVIQADIATGNGVIHVIDSVILPR